MLRTLLILLPALYGLLLGTASASALTLSSDQGPGGPRLIGADPVGAANRVSLSFDSQSRYRVVDLAGIDAAPAGCELISETEARCSRALYYQLVLRLGKGADVASTVGVFRTGRRQAFPFPVNLGPGRDVFRGGRGFNLTRGGPGRDLLRGGGKLDVLAGQGGDDRLVGGPGPDLLSGGDGRDLLLSGPGPDLLLGGPDRDVLAGGPGRDGLLGGKGRDALLGGPGNDLLFGGREIPDAMLGGRGRDSCVVKRGDRVASCERLGVLRRAARAAALSSAQPMRRPLDSLALLLRLPLRGE